MTSSPPLSSIQDSYILNRDSYASTRLNCQHWLWRQELGYNIHPSITLPLHARIADVATGTCAWLLEVANDHPDTQIDGFDLSLEQAPPAAWLSPNTSLQEWNMYTEPSEEFREKYDMVHIRLVGVVIRDGDPSPILRNLGMLLKPGGWLHWDEIDVMDTLILHPSPTGTTTATRRMDGIMKSQGAPEWVSNLTNLMNEQGLWEDVEMQRIKPQKRFLKAYTAMHLGSWMEIASRQEVGSQNRQESENLIKDLSEEVAQGAAFGVAKVICTGKRASK